jgi:hypothetical protein
VILPEVIDMDTLDKNIGKRIKRFADSQKPPADGRSRLLKSVTCASADLRSRTLPERHPIIWKRIYDGCNNSNLSLFSFDWATLYSLGVLSMRNVL